MRLIGKVKSGSGEAAEYLQTEGYVKQFKEKLGYTPFPGTLNVVVEPEYIALVQSLCKNSSILLEAFTDWGWPSWPVNACDATLHGQPVVILFPERSGYGPEILELISAENLRQKLKLADGDKVEILVD